MGKELLSFVAIATMGAMMAGCAMVGGLAPNPESYTGEWSIGPCAGKRQFVEDLSERMRPFVVLERSPNAASGLTVSHLTAGGFGAPSHAPPGTEVPGSEVSLNDRLTVTIDYEIEQDDFSFKIHVEARFKPVREGVMEVTYYERHTRAGGKEGTENLDTMIAFLRESVRHAKHGLRFSDPGIDPAEVSKVCVYRIAN